MANDPRAPYAPAATVILAIQHFRNKGFPPRIDAEFLIRIDGIPESIKNWILSTFKFLDLITDEGQPTSNFENLYKASEDAYSSILADVLHKAYSHIFEVVSDLSNRTSLDTAFRVYQPQAQRPRMVALFVGLCIEAKLVTSTTDTVKTRSNNSKSERTPRSNGTRNQPTKSTIIATEPASLQKQTLASAPIQNTSYDLVMAFIRQLPTNRKWTKSQRDRWLNALSASIDIEIEVINEESANATD